MCLFRGISSLLSLLAEIPGNKKEFVKAAYQFIYITILNFLSYKLKDLKQAEMFLVTINECALKMHEFKEFVGHMFE
jgi:hypothetical protein